MSEIKTNYIDFELAGRVYPLSLTLNIIDALQDRYGDLTDVFKKTAELKEISWIMTQFVNEAIDNHNDDCGGKNELPIKSIKAEIEGFQAKPDLTESETARVAQLESKLNVLSLWENVTVKWVGRKITTENLKYVTDIFMQTFGASMPKPEEDADPNPQTA